MFRKLTQLQDLKTREAVIQYNVREGTASQVLDRSFLGRVEHKTGHVFREMHVHVIQLVAARSSELHTLLVHWI